MRDQRSMSAGSSLDGTTATQHPGGRALRPMALACLMLTTLGLVGCQSGPCGGGPCGNGLLGGFKSGVRSASDSVRNTTARLFRHKGHAPAGECCGGGAVEGMPVEGSVISGGMIPGPVIQSPANESAPTILEPALPSNSSLKGKSSSVPSSLKDLGIKQSAIGRKRSIQSDYPGRGENLARATVTPSADRSAEGANGGAIPTNLLDNVPPVDLDAEIPRRAKASAVPVEADLVKLPVPVTTASSVPKEPELPSIRAGLDNSIAPGFKHFASVKPNINGGSLPTLEGLDFLKERGTKTILDLRDVNDVEPSFVEQVKSRGLRHLSLPVDVNRLDPATVVRFGEEVSRSTGQPVYFFDRDGTRAGMIWYVHRLTVDKVDAQLASHEAEELGLIDKTVWVAAAKYLDSIKAVGKPLTPLPSTTKLYLPPTKPINTSANESSANWRGSAAMIVTGLSAPLVEWSSAALTTTQSSLANPSASAR